MEKGDFVKIDYVGRLESGEVFDLTLEDVAKKENVYDPKIKYKPVTVVLGSGFVIPGLEKALEGMKVGEKKKVELEAADGFGPRNPEMVKTVPKNVFKDQKEPVVGMIVDFSGMKGRIQSVSSGRVTVDFNNPMAGKKLIYDVEVKEKLEKPDEQIKSVFDFFNIQGVSVTPGDVTDIEVANLPTEIKQRIADVVIKNVKISDKPISKVRFTETFVNKQK